MAEYDIGAAFEQIEDELISSMTRNLKRHTVEEVTEGYEWTQWQVLQLQALEDYKRRANARYGTKFSSINDKIEKSITDSYTTAQTEQEKEILKRIRNDLPESSVTVQGMGSFTGEFFKTNDRKLDALIKATTDDMQRAETAVLRMTNDKYRSIIFNAQVYANTGAGTYAKAVDMATKDFLSAGINCIEYKNGRRVNIRSYAEMALRTANKRAYLQGEGEMRKKWGIHTVILNKRTNACPKCAPFVGKVIVDDVWSGGTPEEATKSGYLLMSECIAQGLYHPNCRDSHTTYFGDILDEEEDEHTEVTPNDEIAFTPEEQKLSEQLYEAEQRGNYCERQAERFERLSEYSLDEGNRKVYRARKSEWVKKLEQSQDTIEELKEKIALDEEKQVLRKSRNTVRKPSVVSTMIAQENISDVVHRLSFDMENSEENEEKTVANSAESGIIDIERFDPLSPEKVVPTLRADSNEWINDLSAEEIRAIRKYTKNSGDLKDDKFYAKLNAMLRHEIPKSDILNYYADVISRAISKFKLKYDIICYRTLDFDSYKDFVIGEIFTDPQFTSTSVVKSRTLKKPFVVIINVPKGSKGAYIENISNFPNQREFLIDKNSAFRVISKSDDFIELEVVL